MFAEVFSYDNQIRQEALIEGRVERDIELAQASLKEGLPLSLISKITGLDIEFIEKLQTQPQKQLKQKS